MLSKPGAGYVFNIYKEKKKKRRNEKKEKLSFPDC